MTTVASPVAYGPPLSDDNLSKYLNRAIQFSGSAAGDFYFEDMIVMSSSLPTGWTVFNGGTGAESRTITALKGGVLQFSTGATASSAAGAGTTGPFLINNSLSESWYCATRFRMTTTPDGTNTKASIGIYDNDDSKGIFAGVNCAGSATNFVVSYDGTYGGGTTVVDSGIAYDTSFHTAEFYCRGDSKLRTRWDGGVENASPPTMSNTCNDMLMIIDARNGGQAATQTLQVDWLALYYPHA